MKQNITERRKKKSTKDNNKFCDNNSSKETKSNSKFKSKTNDSISKNVKTTNAKEAIFILGDSMVKKVNGFYSQRILIINALLK